MRLVLLAGLEEEAGRAFCRLLRAFMPDEEVSLMAAEVNADVISRAARSNGAIVAVLWGLNEVAEALHATDFEAQMRILIDRVRQDLGLAETVPFILAVRGFGGPDLSAVEVALERLAATTPYIGLVQAADLLEGGDRLSAEAQELLGERCFRMWKSMSAVSPERLAAQAVKYRDAPRVHTSVLLDPGELLVTSPFGLRPHPVTGEPETFHAGIDGALWNGRMLLETGICAWRDGIVVEAADTDGPAGTCVVLDHGDGFVSRYFHLEHGSLAVASGDHVRAGILLGWMGKTGRATGEHLHFQLEKDGEPIDPLPLLCKSDVESRRNRQTVKPSNCQTVKLNGEVPSP